MEAGYSDRPSQENEVENRLPESHWTVAETFNRCPETAPVFHRFGMACIGCTMAPFETLAEAAEAYELNLETLLSDFNQAISSRQADEQWSFEGRGH